MSSDTVSSSLCIIEEGLHTPSYNTHGGGSISVRLVGTKSNLGSIGEAETIDVVRARLR